MSKNACVKIARIVTIYESGSGYSYVDETFDGETRTAVMTREVFDDSGEALLDAVFSPNGYDASEESKPF